MELDKCTKGNHPLEKIFTFSKNRDEDVAVNWCPECGAVVVDIEFDGRISPGAVVKMKVPRIAKELSKEEV